MCERCGDKLMVTDNWPDQTRYECYGCGHVQVAWLADSEKEIK